MDTYGFIFGALFGLFLLWLWSIMRWVIFHRERTKRVNMTYQQLVDEAVQEHKRRHPFPPATTSALDYTKRVFVVGGSKRQLELYLRGKDKSVRWVPVLETSDLTGLDLMVPVPQQVILLHGWDLNRHPEFKFQVRQLVREISKSESKRAYKKLTTIVEPNLPNI